MRRAGRCAAPPPDHAPPLPPPQELVAGGLAGAVGKTSVAPLERCKILFQVCVCVWCVWGGGARTAADARLSAPRGLNNAPPPTPQHPNPQTGKLQPGRLGATLAGIYAAEGGRGLFRGNGASVLRIVPYAAFHFGAYEYYRRALVQLVYGDARVGGCWWVWIGLWIASAPTPGRPSSPPAPPAPHW